MHNTVIIQGSARPYGHTSTIAEYRALKENFDAIDLYSKNMGHYDYDYKNANDDFIP